MAFCDIFASISQIFATAERENLPPPTFRRPPNDLRNRLAGKPYIFKLAHRIQDDIERIEEMRRFESEYEIDLADYVELT